MKERSYRGLFWILAIVGLVADQVTKYGVFRWLYGGGLGDRFEVWPGVFRLVANYPGEDQHISPIFGPLQTWSGEVLPAVNKGALFGLGGDYEGWANLVFSIVSVVAAVAIVLWVRRRTTASDWRLCAALGLILAGTVGNLYDRVVFGGVRDFLYFYLINWPIFNVADCCLVCGAGVLLLHAFWAAPETVPQPGAKLPEMAEAK